MIDFGGQVESIAFCCLAAFVRLLGPPSELVASGRVRGYALTETTCSGCVQMPGDLRCGLVGPPLDSVEIMLRSCLNAQNEPEALGASHQSAIITNIASESSVAVLSEGAWRGEPRRP